ncbi:hypothetical protein [Streptomyces agglomeratus]|uniref:hypothetical protein n=1 Tax=Streptomyces agglomeratus TaxID=285458 RepID=UPI0034E5F0EA
MHVGPCCWAGARAAATHSWQGVIQTLQYEVNACSLCRPDSELRILEYICRPGHRAKLLRALRRAHHPRLHCAYRLPRRLSHGEADGHSDLVRPATPKRTTARCCGSPTIGHPHSPSPVPGGCVTDDLCVVWPCRRPWPQLRRPAAMRHHARNLSSRRRACLRRTAARQPAPRPAQPDESQRVAPGQRVSALISATSSGATRAGATGLRLPPGGGDSDAGPRMTRTGLGETVGEVAGRRPDAAA